MKASRQVLNSSVERNGWPQQELSGEPWNVHRRLPGYVETSLLKLLEIADELGPAGVWAKDERERFGLPAFKVVGSSWAIYQLIRRECEQLSVPLEPWTTVDDLAVRTATIGHRTLVTATDGNHGRGVARIAKWLHWRARVFMPLGTVDARIEAIRGEGAEVTVIDGSYDDTVRAAEDAASGEEAWLVQDTSWPGYEEIPALIVEGYVTILREIDAALEREHQSWPDLVIVPFGVGALLGTVVRHLRYPGNGGTTRIVTVEPLGAECALESLAARRSVSVVGPAETVMAGLNCGTLGLGILDPLLRGVDAAIAIDDVWAIRALRRLHGLDLPVGESGAASLAGLWALMKDPALDSLRKRLGVTPTSTALVFLTEGITDPEGTARLLQQTP
ncbi:MAG: diaminopropionate ammonia-lyase [bacterium]